MANHKSAAKRARQANVKKIRNLATKNSVRSLEKKVRTALSAKDAKATELLREFASKVSKAAKKGAIPAKTASRKIARLATQLSALTK
ncbi:MAG: 30S ribosomal protein S20 [Bdellovibrionales bacterium]|nr:30S ribosomal protein S20 [Bdellovibrionales bacterium]